MPKNLPAFLRYTLVVASTALSLLDSAFAQANLADRPTCLRVEDEQVTKNKEQMDALFRAAMEKYRGSQPCIGAWARNRHGLVGTICGRSAPHFLIGTVEPGSPAAKAGLIEGDAIVSINSKPVQFHLDFEVQVLQATPGSQISVVVERSGSQFEQQAVVGLLRVAPDSPLTCSPAQ